MSEHVTVSLPSYQWEAILRGLSSSGWDSMHAVLSEKLSAGVVAEEPEWEYGVIRHDGVMVNNGDYMIQQTHRRRKAGPWVPVEN